MLFSRRLRGGPNGAAFAPITLSDAAVADAGATFGPRPRRRDILGCHQTRQLLGCAKFARALPVLVRTAGRAAEIVPLLERPFVHAAGLAVLVDEQRLARRT